MNRHEAEDFYEDDESPEDIRGAFERGLPGGVTGGRPEPLIRNNRMVPGSGGGVWVQSAAGGGGKGHWVAGSSDITIRVKGGSGGGGGVGSPVGRTPFRQRLRRAWRVLRGDVA